jgi:hypothetical protein
VSEGERKSDDSSAAGRLYPYAGQTLDVSSDGDDDSWVDPEPDIVADHVQLAGVWANHVTVAQGEHEFTLDFSRLDFSGGRPARHGILVARVAMSPLFLSRLSDVLTAVWSAYAERALPKEVRGDGPAGEEEAED